MLFLLQLSVYLSINKYPQVFRISYLLNWFFNLELHWGRRWRHNL
jgi:hypothetical protein